MVTFQMHSQLTRTLFRLMESHIQNTHLLSWVITQSIQTGKKSSKVQLTTWEFLVATPTTTRRLFFRVTTIRLCNTACMTNNGSLMIWMLMMIYMMQSLKVEGSGQLGTRLWLLGITSTPPSTQRSLNIRLILTC